MIATIAIQPYRMSPPKEHHIAPRNANTASAPLPMIPRRLSSSRQHTASPPIPANSSTTPVKLVIQPSTPPEGQPSTSTSVTISDSDSSSSSSPSSGVRPTIAPRSKRIRGVRSTAVCPPEQSTPTPAVYNARIAVEHRQPPLWSSLDKNNEVTPRPTTRSMIYTPGIPLRMQTENLKPRKVSESHIRASTESPASVNRSSPQLRLIRKKSGQLVKSSLKSSKSRDSLTVITKGFSTKSEPNTPTHKAVHFDSKLEHVKLFLAEQKPLAVSRDGSPTEDTSGTDNDFPSFIFGDGDAKPKKTLVMQVPNMPSKVDLNTDIALERLSLSSDSTCILGRVRVRNIAYAKWVAVRFTFDSWQTTSEVTAKYLEPINSDFDRFTFSIRLNDLLARIEGKTLYLALRYTVAGREIWDNNSGRNHLAEFAKLAPITENSKSSDDEGSARDIASLRSELEKVVQGRGKAGPSSLAQAFNRNNGLGTVSLAARYDFGTSLKEPWQPSDFTSPLRHLRRQSYPASAISTPNSIPWPEKSKGRVSSNIRTTPPPLGSPRDIDDDVLFTQPRVMSDFDDTPFAVGNRFRNHRRGYFDNTSISVGSSLKRTPPGTPLDDSTPLPTRFHSFPPAEGKSYSVPPYGLGFISGDSNFTDSSEGSEQSTPSLFSSSSSSSRHTSPSPTENFLINSLSHQGDDEEQVSPDTNYRQFLNKFCFFTGSEGLGSASSRFIPRTQSASDIEELLAGTSPRIHDSASFILATPTRSPSLDDVTAVRSGSSTPTAPAFSPTTSPIISESRSATPIAD
ncbi:putative phosphatase regulatory subunit-domain-containing protein [Collybia nuda]|uniref:Phosphatase regulatory subunit-domain-containing protein n=1 Tax=Collybia nuda TaxID=64659 RepID=A0A9P5Y9F7_9AGAR|nr:putative phosphatase regulatory subunit-domain-containing protein [Collybia nuda]